MKTSGRVERDAAKRYQGYLGASPTVQWLNRETGSAANMRPYVQDLVEDDVDAFVSDARHDVLVRFASISLHISPRACFFLKTLNSSFFCQGPSIHTTKVKPQLVCFISHQPIADRIRHVFTRVKP